MSVPRKRTRNPIKPSPNKEERIAPVQEEAATGGRLNRGGNEGNVFGGGQKPKYLRELCAQGFAKAIPIQTDIATGNIPASAAEKTGAFNALGKFGLGELKIEIKDTHIFEALGEVLPRHVDPETAHAILRDLHGELGGSDSGSESED